MRFIDYTEAEYCCARLARRLEAELGDELASSRFIAIPRGGLIVLGMLSYVLDLRQEQLGAAGASSTELTVLVDDCGLSGARFARALAQTTAQRVVFAHLLSHPALRKAIVESERRVEACIAGEDLSTRPSEQRHAAHGSYWRARLPGKRYWLGDVEPIGFSWNEPDRLFWNERTQRLEDDWHQSSPRRCLFARTALGIALSEAAPGPFDVPTYLRWKIDRQEVVIWHSKKDRVFGLKAAAGAMWRALAAYGDEDRAAEYLLGRYDVDATTLRDDLRAFAQELLKKGLLVLDQQSVSPLARRSADEGL